ncbi:MAG: alpha-amylase [Chloroherpetonaceae bacterium]
MSLSKVRSALQSLAYHQPYFIPSLWKNPTSEALTAIEVSPKTFFTEVIDSILASPKAEIVPTENGEWSRSAVIYNLFPRLTAAFDHNQNKRIDTLPDEALRETGTFLKCIALLPYIKSLGATVVHLLPITSIGKDGNKGALGSPYAIKNPYKLDERLSEPALNLDVETEFAAFVEAAHHLGLRIVLEFVFRTAAKDGDWVKEHPEWFYWIDNRLQDRSPQHRSGLVYGNPIFSREELAIINAKVNSGDFRDLPPPSDLYRSFFTDTPETVQLIGGRYIGKTKDGRECRIPGAFADWPPDDTQPPWGDVTYLKMYDHPDFNYIAYNTIRMYSAELAQPKFANKPLWKKIIGIIPHYQDAFGIDGVMIDMGHALPFELKKEMVRVAREKNPDFAFWDENFDITRKSVAEGYNAVMGSLIFVGHQFDELKKFLMFFAQQGVPIPFFGSAENHNTPRTASRFGGGEAGANYSKFIFAVACAYPTIPFIHSGMELCEWYPVNTGIGFAPSDLQKFPSEKLALFSEEHYNWTGGNGVAPIIPFIKRVLEVRKKYEKLIVDPSPDTITFLEIPNSPVLGIVRSGYGKKLLFLANANPYQTTEVSVPLQSAKAELKELISGELHRIGDNVLTVRLGAGESAWFEL